jgi:hypothetical protein
MRIRISQLEAQQKEAPDSHLATVNLSSCHLDTRTTTLRNGNQLDFDTLIRTPKGWQKASLMTDTGASASGFVSANFVKVHQIPTMPLTKPINLTIASADITIGPV